MPKANIKVNINDIGGSIAKQDERYIVKDNQFGNKLVLSSTLLEPNMSTSGHFHNGQEEVYFFVSGEGEMELNSDRFKVRPGDVVNIEDGVFHRVFNTQSNQQLYFVCVFDGGVSARENHEQKENA
ncbi:MAG: cupin domain-containing protein [Pseudomonadota bacterium]|nr:cupin domain-containing protein [Pseudomonadota bacterium]URQ70615.1 cupin domain-containing protein [SAR86 cluster bacterium]|tara:strand:+ start:1323 stop:1700 length:378 start_codon:yes stop_codon:yes gene_type:complete